MALFLMLGAFFAFFACARCNFCSLEGQVDNIEGGCAAKQAFSKFDAKTDPSSARNYFYQYGQLYQQQYMLQDHVRTEAYHSSFMENQDDFRDHIVVDVGAGSGILSLFAAQAGAKHVYAVEASRMAHYARRLIAANPSLSDRITVINGKAEEVELPEKADILVSELMGILLVNERALETNIIARNRFLRPGGKMFPSLGRIYMAPFSDDSLFAEVADKAMFWHQTNFFGIDISTLHSNASEGYFSQPIVRICDPNTLVAEAAMHTLDWSNMKEEELYNFEVPLNFTVFKTGPVHGLACWFDVLFDGSTTQRWLTTAPGQPSTHWYQVQLVFSSPLYAVAGEAVSGVIRFSAHSAQSYDIYLTMSASAHSSSGRFHLQNFQVSSR